MYEKPVTVLLVDSDENDYILISNLLSESQMGTFEVEWVGTYVEGLEKTSENQHDVYMLDDRLGDRTGLELLRSALEKGCTEPIILLTGQGDRQVDIEAMNAGAADYLIKSKLEPQLLERSVRYAIERKRVEKALRLSQDRYALAVGGGQVGVWDWNIQTNKLYISPNLKAMLGYADIEIGNNWDDWNKLIHAEDIEQVMKSLETHLGGLIGQYEVEYRRLHKDRTWRWFLSRGIALRDAEGKPYRMAGSETDITERKQLEAYLRQALAREKELSELKSRFVTMVSHEFRTPLATILSSADLMEFYVESGNSDKLLQHISQVQKATEYMTQMLEDVLTIGQAEAGKLKLKPTQLNLSQFCLEIVRDLDAYGQNKIDVLDDYVGTKNNRIRLVEQKNLEIKAFMDAKMLKQVLNNLLSNALKYSAKEVYFELSYEDEMAEFKVQDSGIGITPEDQVKILEPFHRGENVENIPGTGLGLAIVKKCVDLHGGLIFVKSELGIGTTFTVKLPLHQPEYQYNDIP